jgi:putative endonuclease
MREHRKQKGEKKSFSGRYNCYRLVYFEVFNKPMEAIRREKEIKNFSRERKIALIKTKNRNFHTYNIW